VDGGDRGIAIQLSEVALEDVARASGMVAKGDPRLPARAGRITPRLTLAVHALLREAADAPDPARVEELVGELAREAVTSARGAAVPGAPRDARRRYEKAVNSALELIAHRFRSRLSLAEIAAAAAYSPFHFSAVFRRVTGHSVHQYVLRLRLREAASRIAQGERNLSALAHELGFSSHSHFTLSFRREYGITPSGFRGRGAHA
jgi:AraC-like DNA-binding protein